MPIAHKVDQGSQEWYELRAGIPTASEFHRIVTPGGKLSKQSAGYMHHLLAELLLGRPIVQEETRWMMRGHDLEEEAVRAYEFQTDQKTEPGGFITDDAAVIGASPDRLVGVDGLLEIKCPAEHTHVGYMTTREVEAEKLPQIQGQLLVTGRKWVDLMSYHPELPRVVVRVERDEKYISLLSIALFEFVAELRATLEQLDKAYGRVPRKPSAQPKEFISDEDVNAILAAHGFDRRV